MYYWVHLNYTQVRTSATSVKTKPGALYNGWFVVFLCFIYGKKKSTQC